MTSKEAIESMQSKIDNDDLTLRDVAEAYIRVMKGVIAYEAAIQASHDGINDKMTQLMSKVADFAGIWIMTGSMENATEMRETCFDADFPDTMDGRAEFVKRMFESWVADFNK